MYGAAPHIYGAEPTESMGLSYRPVPHSCGSRVAVGGGRDQAPLPPPFLPLPEVTWGIFGIPERRPRAETRPKGTKCPIAAL